MALRNYILLSVLLVAVAAQNRFRVCVSSTSQCQALELGDSQVICTQVESRVDCALQMAKGNADVGYFTDEELFVLAQTQPTEHRIVATIRDRTKLDNVSFEAVAVVRSTHTNGLAGLQGKKYCHPGLGEAVFRWSPRVERELETRAAATDRCPDADHKTKTAEEMEVARLNDFFGDSCRPGAWSANETLDAQLKRQYPKLCALCANNCNYVSDMDVNIAGVNNNNAHIRALECLRTSGDVAYVAWAHVREFFTIRNPESVSEFSVLCPNGQLQQLTTENLSRNPSPCAFVTQPWSAIVASSARANDVQTNLRVWWPQGNNPSDNSWRSTLYSILVPQSSSAQVLHENSLLTPANYTQEMRSITPIESAPVCVPARVWCTTSTQEQNKCNWVRAAAYSLGIKPTISCQQRPDVFECLRGVRDRTLDFVATAANYGYLARQHYSLTPVKLMQNLHSDVNSYSRILALVKNTASNDISRFENLRGKRACFPEFGGIAYVSFLRAAQEIGVISSSECDYAKAVGEYFDSSCAPGALDASHSLATSDYNANKLCTACKSTSNANNFTCAWDFASNVYFGNNGSLSCLNDDSADVAFVETTNITDYLAALRLDGSQFRALCRNNTLAIGTGVRVEDDCLLAYVVDSEVLTRRGSYVRPAQPDRPINHTDNKPPPPLRPVYVNDDAFNSISTLLESLEKYFGYGAASGFQHVNLVIFSSFDGTRDLLFKNTAVGFSEPTTGTNNAPIKNYIELFRHLQACTGSASNIPVPGLANRSFYSAVTLLLSGLLTRFILY